MSDTKPGLATDAEAAEQGRQLAELLVELEELEEDARAYAKGTRETKMAIRKRIAELRGNVLEGCPSVDQRQTLIPGIPHVTEITILDGQHREVRRLRAGKDAAAGE